jgi:pimeloyl-ACP methyl ester carboxylesterase
LITTKTADTARGPMAVLESGAGWPVILVHGFPLSAAMWRPQLERVPQGWRFIAPDLRGFGGTPIGGEPPAMDTYALDILALMDCCEIDSAAIVGFSMGGYVAFAMHRLAAGRCQALVLAATRPQADTPAGRDGRVQMRRMLAEQGPAAVSAAMLPKLLSPAADARVREQVRALIESVPAAAIDAALVAMMDRPDSTPDLARIAVATLVIVGEDDVVTPLADAEGMRSALRRGALTTIPRAGHMANFEQPDVFSRVLADFLLAHD